MKKGDYIMTPRFCTVIIEDILSVKEAKEKGYTVPTHYKSSEYDICGKHIGTNRMEFVAIKKHTGNNSMENCNEN